jgi:putative thioredoxin
LAVSIPGGSAVTFIPPNGSQVDARRQVPPPERPQPPLPFSAMAAIDVTDATFQTDVLQRSTDVPVVVDLWAPWCGPCRTLGPIIEKVVDETGGQVVLTKVNVDENPQISQAFGVQSIPLVVAVKDGQPVDGFLGAYPEATVREFVQRLLPTEQEQTVAALIASGDETSLRQALEVEPDNEDAIVVLAELLVGKGETEEALALLARVPESERTRRVAALARVGDAPADDYDATLTLLLPRVKADDEARQEFVDILELMGPDDPRTADYRRQLTRQLY